jgi:hypothetical protein
VSSSFVALIDADLGAALACRDLTDEEYFWEPVISDVVSPGRRPLGEGVPCGPLHGGNT